MNKNVLLFFGFFLLFAKSADAFWDVSVSDKDVFGNTNVTVSTYGDNGTIVRFECGSSSEPLLAFLIRDDVGEIPSVSATFLHVDEVGGRRETQGTLKSWNDKFVAVVVTDTAMMRGIADHMLVAQKSIPVGIEVGLFDLRVSDTLSAYGSTAAGKALLEHCLK